MKRPLLISSVLAIVALAGCARENALAPPSKLVIGVLEEPRSLNPLFLEGAMSATVGPIVYSHLLTVDGAGNLRPDLAAEVPSKQNGGISSDNRTITYHLRPGLLWQDGAPLTAADVAFTYSAIMNARNPVPARYGYDQVASVTAPDARTVRVRMKRIYAPILSMFFGPDQNYQVLPAHLLAAHRDLNGLPFNDEPVGSGPYRVALWRRGDKLELRANATYYAGRPRIAEIDLAFVPDSTTLLNELRTGEIDAVFDADPYHVPEYQKLAHSVVTSTPIMGFEALLFNTADPIVHDPSMRRAIVESLDLARIVHDATRGAESMTDAQRGFFSWAYDPSVPGPRFDAADASRLFDAAGWRRSPDGLRRRGGTPLTLYLAYQAGSTDAESLAVMLQQALRKAGVALEMRRFMRSQFVAPGASGGPLFGGRYQLALFGALRSIDPNDQWALGYNQMPPNGFNVTRFCDAGVTRADDADAATYVRDDRRRDMRIVQQRVGDELPFVVLWQRRTISVYPTWLHGVDPSPLSSFWNVGTWWISSHTKV